MALELTLVKNVVDSAGFCTSGTWLEKHFSGTESFSVDGNDDVSAGEPVPPTIYGPLLLTSTGYFSLVEWPP